MAIERIGFIGLGNMGAPMAANLEKAGFALSVFDIRESVVREFAAAHRASIARSLAAIGTESDCVITMLPDDHAVRSVILGEGADCVAATLDATGRNHPLEKKVIPHILTRKYASGMAIGFIAKDLRIAVDAARSSGAVAPLAECVQELWENAAREIGATADQTEIVRYWERMSGITL